MSVGRLTFLPWTLTSSNGINISPDIIFPYAADLSIIRHICVSEIIPQSSLNHLKQDPSISLINYKFKNAKKLLTTDWRYLLSAFLLLKNPSIKHAQTCTLARSTRKQIQNKHLVEPHSSSLIDWFLKSRCIYKLERTLVFIMIVWIWIGNTTKLGWILI